ncbi:hypothetical protein F4781DRAFT_151320 [Annulohypoxylon bovei var. microspora]|nr:hypothetical protein F4781DRAFT_151320 [Annulohypoxylon bovei var. microspora]
MCGETRVGSEPGRPTSSIRALYDGPPGFQYFPPGGKEGPPKSFIDEPLDSFFLERVSPEATSRVDVHTSLLLHAPSPDADTGLGSSSAPTKIRDRPEDGRAHVCPNALIIQQEKLASFFEMTELFQNSRGSLLDYIDRLHKKMRQSLNAFTVEGVTFGPMWGLRPEPRCPGQGFLGRMFLVSRFIDVKQCEHSQCARRYNALDIAAPPCRWVPFRNLVLTIIACWMPGLLHAIVILQFDWQPEVIIDGTCCLDVEGVNDVLDWAFRVTFSKNLFTVRNDDELYNAYARFRSQLQPGYDSQAMAATYRCLNHGICPNRLWNISIQGDENTSNISHLAAIVLETGAAPDKGRHRLCTDSLCLYSHENSTTIKQLHRCRAGSCMQEMKFPPELLDRSFKDWKDIQTSNLNRSSNTALSFDNWPLTAWRITELHEGWPLKTVRRFRRRPRLCTQGSKYMALSHVWSDGTGVGMKSAGKVNTCLFEYFSDIARRLNCTGVWWDTICIPAGRAARKLAMDGMLRNYERAAVTVIHDMDLMNLEWSEDGRPAVALVLSAWFTRGWTAAELFASRGHPVKVLFKDPANPHGPPLIKDLHTDVFAWNPQPTESRERPSESQIEALGETRKQQLLSQFGKIPRLGHYVATEILQRCHQGGVGWFADQTNAHLYKDSISTLRDVLQVLRPRVTSWVSDRLVIAALMCLPPSKLDSAASGPEISKQIIRHFHHFLAQEIFHVQIPMTTFGPWSWCPPSIFDLGQSMNSLTGKSQTACIVEANGVLTSQLSAYSILPYDRIVSTGSHLALAARISVALSNRKNCLLLADGDESSPQFILVQPVAVDLTMNLLRTQYVACRWIGCVYLENSLNQHLSPSVKEQTEITSEIRRQCWDDLQVSTSKPYFVFGEDVDENNQPLESMSAKSALCGVRAHDRFERPGPTLIYYLTEGYNKIGDESRRYYPPTPVYFYRDPVDRIVTKEERRYRSSAGMQFDMEVSENRISASFAVDILSRLQLRITACSDTHPYLCRGQVVLNWSFPVEEIDEQTIRVIFKSTFHMIEQDHFLGEYELSVGKTTYENEIEPITWLRGLDDQFEECLYTCYSLGQEEEIENYFKTGKPAMLIDGVPRVYAG